VGGKREGHWTREKSKMNGWEILRSKTWKKREKIKDEKKLGKAVCQAAERGGKNDE